MVKITKRENLVPEEIKRPVKMAFEAQARKNYFEEQFGEAKKLINDFYNEVPFEVSDSKSLQTEYGKITAQTRSNYSVDKDKLMELINDGKINAMTVLNLVSTFKVEGLISVLGTASAEIITENPQTHFAFTATPSFKAEVASEMAVLLGMEMPVVEVKPTKVKPTKPIPMAVKSAVEVDSELANLLKSMDGKVDAKPKAKKGKK